jgi:ferritin-like metal-binding protein YciE
VIPFAHDYTNPPVGNTLQIGYDATGKCVPAIGLFLDSQVDTSGRADLVFRMASNGFMRACSIGFKPLKQQLVAEKGGGAQLGPYGRGYDYQETDLMEWSPCPIPANPEALQASMKGITLHFQKDEYVLLNKFKIFENPNTLDMFIEMLEGHGTVKLFSPVEINLKGDTKPLSKEDKPKQGADKVKPVIAKKSWDGGFNPSIRHAIGHPKEDGKLCVKHSAKNKNEMTLCFKHASGTSTALAKCHAEDGEQEQGKAAKFKGFSVTAGKHKEKCDKIAELPPLISKCLKAAFAKGDKETPKEKIFGAFIIRAAKPPEQDGAEEQAFVEAMNEAIADEAEDISEYKDLIDQAHSVGENDVADTLTSILADEEKHYKMLNDALNEEESESPADEAKEKIADELNAILKQIETLKAELETIVSEASEDVKASLSGLVEHAKAVEGENSPFSLKNTKLFDKVSLS